MNASPKNSLQFWGSPSADLFTKELAASYQGVIEHNMVTDPHDSMVGFLSASIDGRPWTDTAWTRDAGTFLREMVQWGDLPNACLAAKNLISMVKENSQGFCTFPQHFERGKPGSGSELDGTCAIVIGLVLLWERLEKRAPFRAEIEYFLRTRSSPLAYMLRHLDKHPLLPGSGEFGGGLGFEKEFYNVVQNHLARLALLAAARMVNRIGDTDQATACTRAAEQISANMLRYLRAADGAWLWAVDAESLQPDPAVIGNIYNKGSGCLNGVLSMWADVLGLTPMDSQWEGLEPSLQTFNQLFNTPKRRAMFEKYGAWTQFDDLWEGYLTTPSYGHGYATQVMLLTDKLEMAGKALDFLAQMTCQPFAGNSLDRESPYYFYERCHLPELLEAWSGTHNQRNRQPEWIANGFDGQNFDQGCGALNLVNVAEPLKIARLVLGVDDSNPAETRLVPRLPPGWAGCDAKNWPIFTGNGVVHADLRSERSGDRFRVAVRVHGGRKIPALSVRFAEPEGFVWRRDVNVSTAEFR